MKRHLLIIVLAVLLVISAALNIWAFVPFSSSPDKVIAEPGQGDIYAFFAGNPPVNEAAPDSIWIIHHRLNTTEQIVLVDSGLGYSYGYDNKGFEVDYGAKFASPNSILYTVYFAQNPPQNGSCPLNKTKSTPDKFYYDSNY
jgi:hypothetical protein